MKTCPHAETEDELVERAKGNRSLAYQNSTMAHEDLHRHQQSTLKANSSKGIQLVSPQNGVKKRNPKIIQQQQA